MSDRSKTWIAVIAIAVLGFAVYVGSVNGEFIWDDEHLVENNTTIRNWKNIAAVFVEDIGAGGGKEYNFYRPIQMLTYMADYSLWKLDPKGYHLTNIVLHILVALLVYYLLYLLFADQLIAFLAGAFFAVHPIHTEAVTYISGRADLLAALFLLGAFIFYIKNRSSSCIRGYIFIVLSYVLALFSKESSLILPVLVLLYHLSFKEKIEWKSFAAVLAPAVVYVLLRTIVLKDLSVTGIYATTFSERLPGFFVALAGYVRLLFLPFGLHMGYGRKLFLWSDPQAVVGLVILAGALFYAFKRREKEPIVFFGILWFIAALLPMSNLFPVNAYMAEHWLYLPSIGIFLILAKALSVGAYCNTPLQRNFTIIIIICLLGFFSYLTIRQNSYWKDPATFFERTKGYAPDNAEIYYNLGTTYVDQGENPKALRAFQKAVEIDPKYALAYNNLGNVYKAANRIEEAIGAYKKAISFKSGFSLAYNNLGLAYFGVNQWEESVSSYKKALEADPENSEAYNNLGVAYAVRGKVEEALVAYKQAIRLMPEYANAYYNIGNVYQATGDFQKAAASYENAIKYNPQDADAARRLEVLKARRQE